MEGDGNIYDPRDIDGYYTALFADARDDAKLTEAIGMRDFAEVDRRYRLIPESGEKLIVPYSGMGGGVRASVGETAYRDDTRADEGSCAPYRNNLSSEGSRDLCGTGFDKKDTVQRRGPQRLLGSAGTVSASLY